MSVYVGIDVHRERSRVAVVTEDGKVQLNKNVVNGSEPMLRLIGDLPSGTPVAFGAAFGWSWLARTAGGLRVRRAPGASAAVQGDRLGAAEERQGPACSQGATPKRSHAGANASWHSPACRIAIRWIGGAVPGTARPGQRVGSCRLPGLHPRSPLAYRVALDPAAGTAPSHCGRPPGGGSPAHNTRGRCLSSLHPALQASHPHHPARPAIVVAASPGPEVMAHYGGCA